MKERITIHLPKELIDRLRNAVYWTPGATIAGLAEAGIEREIARLEKANGGPFAKRGDNLRGGRPVRLD